MENMKKDMIPEQSLGRLYFPELDDSELNNFK